MAIITEQTGDIFSAPINAILIHACNAKGVWGAGVALSFKKRFPKAFKSYKARCNPPGAQSTQLDTHRHSLAGTTFLIPPSSPNENQWIACLFTSVDYGRRVDDPEKILLNTERAVADLGRQIAELKMNQAVLGECWAVRINSGKFGVEWDHTKVVLENGSVDMRVIQVAVPDAKEEGEAEQRLRKKEVDDGILLHKGEGNIEATKRRPRDEENKHKTLDGGSSTKKG